MSIEIPVYKTVSLPVETQVASLDNNLSQSSVANFNNLMSMPSAIERSSFDHRLDPNFTQINNNSMLNQVLHSISTLDLSLKTSSSNLRQSFSKNNNLTERVSEVGKETIKTSANGDINSSISSLTSELNNNLEKVKNLYQLQHKFHKSMTLVTLFSSLLTAFKGTMDKFLKM